MRVRNGFCIRWPFDGPRGGRGRGDGLECAGMEAKSFPTSILPPFRLKYDESEAYGFDNGPPGMEDPFSP